MIKLATVFSGIGSIEHALKKQNIKNKIIFACDNGERYLNLSYEDILLMLKNKSSKQIKSIIKKLYDATNKENFVKKSYFANYDISEDKWYEDIRFLNGKNFANKIDLFVGGSPCQSFSMSGYRRGLEDARGTLFYDYARMVSEIKPKVFIYENVPGLLNHDHGKTFKIISNIFDSLDYKWTYKILNAKDYGIPQNRKRVYVVGFRKDLKIKEFIFPKPFKLTKFVKDFLQQDPIDRKYFHGEKGFKWVTSKKSLEKRVSINSKIARTQTANQQFNWCGDMIFCPISEQKWALNDKKIYIGTFKGIKGVCRKLTPRECLRLMGYDDSFQIVVDDKTMYRQAGNSIVVNVMEELIKQIIKTGVFKHD